MSKKRIVVLGAGFGGLEFAKKFEAPNTEVLVIDRQNHHLFQPLLYQVATAGLSAPEIAAPIRKILRKKRQVRVLLDEVLEIRLSQKSILLRDEGELSYDYLVIAVGARTNYFGNDQWEAFAPGLKTLDDATRMRQNVLLAFEEAERTSDPEEIRRLTTIVVIGGGPTGVELAGAFAELTRHVLSCDFHNIDAQTPRIILLEVAPRILLPFTEKLSASAKHQLETLGVDVRLNQKIKDIDADGVTLENERIDAANIFWGAGVVGSPVLETMGIELARGNKIPVEPDCSVPGYPEVFAVGDIVALKDAQGKPVPGVSPAAMQMGRHVAKVIRDELASGRTQPPAERAAFTYKDKGSMATIGRSRAVAQIGKLHFGGFFAWLAWLGVHLVFLIGFRNQLAVLIQWFYSYINYKRGARIITGLDSTFLIRNPKAKPISRIERMVERLQGKAEKLPPTPVADKDD